ncbi:hypothetical protein KAU43_01435 [candidate division WOR-3 bacterium]|nr:hypothetical protein [candidate division WOR-3 bacterium]
MKLDTPPKIDCRYIHRKLKEFYNDNEDIGESHPINQIEFDRAIKRFCAYYNLPIPKIEWYSNIDGGSTLGKCHDHGEIWLLTPATHPHSRDMWIDTVYHELGHYVLWAEAEPKAEAFADRMMRKWRK